MSEGTTHLTSRGGNLSPGNGGGQGGDVDKRLAKIEGQIPYLATKEDLQKIEGQIQRIEGQIQYFATKEDLQRIEGQIPHLATKEDIQRLEGQIPHLATKEDLQKIKVWGLTSLVGGISGGMGLAASIALAIVRLID